MITTLTAILATALLFAWFGAFALADGPGKGGCHGDCGACTGDGACATEIENDLHRSEP